MGLRERRGPVAASECRSEPVNEWMNDPLFFWQHRHWNQMVQGGGMGGEGGGTGRYDWTILSDLPSGSRQWYTPSRTCLSPGHRLDVSRACRRILHLTCIYDGVRLWLWLQFFKFQNISGIFLKCGPWYWLFFFFNVFRWQPQKPAAPSNQ